jgi:UDP-N-acetylglucosamine acyltransferase
LRAIRNAYRVLYRSELKLEEALVQLRDMVVEQPCVAAMVEFIEKSSRGLAR